MGRGRHHAKQGAPALGPSDPPSSHLVSCMIGYFQTIHCVRFHLLAKLLAENCQKSGENPPNLKKNKNRLCQKEATSSEALVSNCEEPSITVRLWGNGEWWWWWFISCFSSPVNSTILFCFRFSPLLTPQCC